MEMLLVEDLIDYNVIKHLEGDEYSYLNRSLYDNIPLSIKTEVIKEGRECLSKSFDFLTLQSFQEFLETGNRSNYEKVFFEKRRTLGSLVLAEAVENKNNFTSKIEEGIWALLSELTWTIPAHNSYIRDTLQLNAPDISRPILDLFSCETGEILALTSLILNDKLNPILLKDIRFSLEERILKPYLNSHFWWMGQEGEKLLNWSVWCTQNVLLALLYLKLDKNTLSKVVKKAATTLDLFIKSYPEDGCCDEGASYFHAAGLTLFSSISLLGNLDKNVLKLFSEPKLKAISNYIENVHIKDDIYLNFEDCSPKAGTLTAREYLFGKAVNNQELKNHAIHDFKYYTFKESDNDYNLYYRFLALKYGNEIYAQNPLELTKPSFVNYKTVGLTIYRRDDITLAVKTGSNNDSHNHNDVGSITLYKGKEAILLDVGVETYTKTTFSPLRYTLWPMQSLYHNVVNFNAQGQGFGSEFKSEKVIADERHISFNLEKAYPEGLVKSYRRTVYFDKELKVEEECLEAQSPRLTLMLSKKPELKGNRLCFENFEIIFDSSSLELESIEIKDERLLKALPNTIYRALINFDSKLNWTIKFKKE